MKDQNLRIREMPACLRPREKAQLYGVERLSDSELLGILLGSGSHGRNVLELADEILSRFENLRRLAIAPLRELQKIKGVGPVKALEIKSCLELARRFQQISFAPGMVLTHCQQVFAHYHERLRDQKKEQFFSILLDSKNRLIREELVSVGSLNFSVVHPREVFGPAIRESAAAMILLHNHPSGDPTPSSEDILVTQRLVEVGKIVGIDVLDHIVIGNGFYVSFVRERLTPFSEPR